MIGAPIVSHVLPGLGVIRELVARGHRVTYADDPALADRITATGAEFVPCTTVLPVAGNDWPADPVAAMGLFLDEAVQALPQLRTAYDDDPADLYLYDIGAYAARALAESQGRPLMQLSPSFVAWEGYEDEVAAHLRALPGAGAYRERFAHWLAGCGAATLDVDAFSGTPARALALIPRAMQPSADKVDTGAVTFVGPCFDAAADHGRWTRPEGAENVLLISLGSAYTHRPEFYRQCLAAYGNLSGLHIVLQIGKYTDPRELGDIPPNVEVHSWVPQRAILEQADAFLTHAGMGGCGEGLLGGVPMIAVPQGAEQFMNADRLVELGVARRIDTPDATAETLRAALEELIADPEVARRCAQLRADARSEGGPRRAADLIEDMLAPGGVRTRPESAPTPAPGPT
ncbi:glycosyl transferase [Streptomyces filamentosus]|uniref:Glycosyl transferase n=3 Tax=Streptomyces TaxID=1883 RepID=A0ABY4UNT5_STRFL|nr:MULTISPECIES: macrolide family glycosyltransferase [Streptomyces]EFE78845.1 macrolide glycosyl transferase [Streptomyces filamentosus NRRL 15998]EWS95705.1 macrolide glycosyl transferase [Streptomyces filamentosus NRRL 11379]MYR82696.1 glycosyl transferase [Streptomyces sp. SID5466]USC45863.1 glycosyl transferase [Streptomyces filamentosus]